MTQQFKIYLVTQDKVTGYDTYDSFICVAESEEQAANMLPNHYITWNDTYDSWPNSPDEVKVENLGLVTYTDKYKQPGVILTSFNGC